MESPTSEGIKMLESLLTTEQVARYLRVDKFTVYRLVPMTGPSRFML